MSDENSTPKGPDDPEFKAGADALEFEARAKEAAQKQAEAQKKAAEADAKMKGKIRVQSAEDLVFEGGGQAPKKDEKSTPEEQAPKPSDKAKGKEPKTQTVGVGMGQDPWQNAGAILSSIGLWGTINLFGKGSALLGGISRGLGKLIGDNKVGNALKSAGNSLSEFSDRINKEASEHLRLSREEPVRDEDTKDEQKKILEQQVKNLHQESADRQLGGSALPLGQNSVTQPSPITTGKTQQENEAPSLTSIAKPNSSDQTPEIVRETTPDNKDKPRPK